MKSWTLAPARGYRCGYLGCPIAQDEPMQIIETPMGRKLYRCRAHAHGPVDEAQIAAVVAAREAARHAPVRAAEATRRPDEGFRPLKAVVAFADLPAAVQARQQRIGEGR
jgi:hypothetical protein